jgi:hypothetical protein
METMAHIQDQHRAAFRNVNAYVIVNRELNHKGEPQQVGSVAFKHSPDGAAVWCYLRIHGVGMTRYMVGGGGYDKHTASCEGAAGKFKPAPDTWPSHRDACDKIQAIMADPKLDGMTWDNRLHRAGFDVWQAV